MTTPLPRSQLEFILSLSVFTTEEGKALVEIHRSGSISLTRLTEVLNVERHARGGREIKRHTLAGRVATIKGRANIYGLNWEIVTKREGNDTKITWRPKPKEISYESPISARS